MLFTEFVAQLAVESKLPFSLDFKLKTRGVNKATRSVVGFDLPIYGSLLIRERYFLESFQAHIIKQATLFEVELEKLAFNYMKSAGLDSMQLARLVVTGQGTSSTESSEAEIALTNKANDLRESELFREWAVAHNEEIQASVQMVNAFANSRFNETVILTFFMASRTGGNWSLEDTMSLIEDEYIELQAYYNSEAGISDDSVAVEPAPDKVTDLGKE